MQILSLRSTFSLTCLLQIRPYNENTVSKPRRDHQLIWKIEISILPISFDISKLFSKCTLELSAIPFERWQPRRWCQWQSTDGTDGERLEIMHEYRRQPCAWKPNDLEGCGIYRCCNVRWTILQNGSKTQFRGGRRHKFWNRQQF